MVFEIFLKLVILGIQANDILYALVFHASMKHDAAFPINVLSSNFLYETLHASSPVQDSLVLT